MHLCPGNWEATGHSVVYYAQAAHTFSAGINVRTVVYSQWMLILP